MNMGRADLDVPSGQPGAESAAWGREDPLTEEMTTNSIILTRKIIVGYSPWGCKQSNMTEHMAYT